MSEQHVRQAFNLNPNDAETMMQKGRLLAMRGKPEEAWVGSRLPSASIRCIRLGTTLISASRSIRFGVLTRPRRRSDDCRTRVHGRVRGLQPVMAISKGAQRHRQQWRKSYACSPISRRRTTCARAFFSNVRKTASFSAKACSRLDCRNSPSRT